MSANGCSCDFCTGKKRLEENWCARCAMVRLPPPADYRNMDVCGPCDEAIRAECEADAKAGRR